MKNKLLLINFLRGRIRLFIDIGMNCSNQILKGIIVLSVLFRPLKLNRVVACTSTKPDIKTSCDIMERKGESIIHFRH